MGSYTLYTNFKRATMQHVGNGAAARRAAPLRWILPGSAHRPTPPSEQLQTGDPQRLVGSSSSNTCAARATHAWPGYRQLACKGVVNISNLLSTVHDPVKRPRGGDLAATGRRSYRCMRGGHQRRSLAAKLRNNGHFKN